MASIRWSLTAEQDLRDIEQCIARDSPVYAVHTVNHIIEAAERLAAFPLSGRMVPEFEREDLREVICGSYRVVHLASQGAVTVLRVVHGARDIISLSQREPWDSIA